MKSTHEELLDRTSSVPASPERTLPDVIAELPQKPYAVEFGVETFNALFADFLDSGEPGHGAMLLGMEIGWAMYHPEGIGIFLAEDGARLGEVEVRVERRAVG